MLWFCSGCSDHPQFNNLQATKIHYMGIKLKNMIYKKCVLIIRFSCFRTLWSHILNWTIKFKEYVYIFKSNSVTALRIQLICERHSNVPKFSNSTLFAFGLQIQCHHGHPLKLTRSSSGFSVICYLSRLGTSTLER